MGTVARIFVAEAENRDVVVSVTDPRQLHHLVRVRRLHVGDQVECFDGRGHAYRGMVASMEKGRLDIQLQGHKPAEMSPLRLTLGQALPRGDRFEWVVQKATELGAVRLVPLMSRYTVVRLSSGHAETKRRRWQRIATEAAQQCGRATIPTIDLPQPFTRFLPTLEHASLILMPTLAVTAIPLSEVISTHVGITDVVVLIGPEGDFSRDEVVLAERYGVRPVSLGPLTLRAETAALATVTILQYVFGW